MTMPRVFNKSDQNIPSSAVFIGRPSKWGNPFVIGKDGTRSEVIAKYRTWLVSNQKLLTEVKEELVGKDLVCYCAPKACHGDVLIEIANSTTLPFDD